jgi:adenosylhomocysteine nucleosidase
MSRIAVFAALRWECRPALHRLRRVRRDRLGSFTVWRGAGADAEVWVVQTGMGTARAADAARLVRDADHFDLFLSTGCAGALSPSLHPGDLVIGTAVLGDGARIASDPMQMARAEQAAQSAALPVTQGPLLCSPHVLASAAAKRLGAASGAIAVDMEGVAIATCAAQAAIPFLSVRSILDTADTELDASGFVDPQSGRVKPLALAAHLAGHPSTLPYLLSMQRMMRAAQLSLERFFRAWLAAD